MYLININFSIYRETMEHAGDHLRVWNGTRFENKEFLFVVIQSSIHSGGVPQKWGAAKE